MAQWNQRSIVFCSHNSGNACNAKHISFFCRSLRDCHKSIVIYKNSTLCSRYTVRVCLFMDIHHMRLAALIKVCQFLFIHILSPVLFYITTNRFQHAAADASGFVWNRKTVFPFALSWINVRNLKSFRKMISLPDQTADNAGDRRLHRHKWSTKISGFIHIFINSRNRCASFHHITDLVDIFDKSFCRCMDHAFFCKSTDIARNPGIRKCRSFF